MLKNTTYILTKIVNSKLSTKEIGVYNVDFPKNLFDESRDTTEIVL